MLAHGQHNPAMRAMALQYTQHVGYLRIAHAQYMRWANVWQSRSLKHAPETARHVEVVASVIARHVDVHLTLNS